MNRGDLVKSILENEGFRSEPYDDTEGYATIGIGFLLSELNLEKYCVNKENPYVDFNTALDILNDKLDEILKKFYSLNWTDSLPDVIQEIFIEMIYQLGFDGFKKFKKMIMAAKKEDWNRVCKEMINSKWYRQTTSRVNSYLIRIKRELDV